MSQEELSEKRMGRMTAFFDAVLAIAITLLILELGIPQFDNFDMEALDSIAQPLTNLVLSFLVLSNVWIAHARYFTAVTVWDQLIMYGHLVVIFLAAVFPKTTSLFSTYPTSKLAFGIYIGNFLLMFAVLHLTGIYGLRLALAERRESYGKASGLHFIRNLPEASQKQFVRVMGIELVLMVIDMVLMTAACALLVVNPMLCYLLFAADAAVTAITGAMLHKILPALLQRRVAE